MLLPTFPPVTPPVETLTTGGSTEAIEQIDVMEPTKRSLYPTQTRYTVPPAQRS